MKRCISCGKTSKSFASFPCPECGTELVRCGYCRENKNVYKCGCGVVGP